MYKMVMCVGVRAKCISLCWVGRKIASSKHYYLELAVRIFGGRRVLEMHYPERSEKKLFIMVLFAAEAELK